MKRKLLYIVGGIIAFLVLIVIVAPKQEIKQTKDTEQNVPAVENSATSSFSQISNETETDTPPPSPQYSYYPISSVVDGDTVKINMNRKIETFRLIGMDTPETVDPRKSVQCFGIEASNKAKELLLGKKVRIETDSSQGTYDKYNRLLGYIFLEDGVFYNKNMIEQGYAHEYTYNSPYKYQTEFKNAQKEAQDNERGLWSPDTCNGVTATASATDQTVPAIIPSGSQFYTSSYGNAKYYYPVSCSGWKSLSPKYLKGFNTLDDLLKAYPSRTKSPGC